MPDITAKLVNDLRGRTGLPMMDCKKALVETAGDSEKAYENLRKKGLKASVSERAAGEGRVAVAVDGSKKLGVIVEVNCTTDFTAKSDVFARLANDATAKLLANPQANLAEDAQIKQDLLSASQQTGEPVRIGRTTSLRSDGTVGSYLYSAAGKGKIAVLTSVTGKVDDELLRNLGIHIAAARPIALTRAEVPADVLAKEKEIAVEQAKASGKLQAIAEKIAEGKMNSFFAERVLLDQEFINAEVFKGSVGTMLKNKGATLEKFIRIEVGQ